MSLIAVVDDDQSVRESLQGLLASLGYRVAAFDSAEGYLRSDCVGRTDCLILDVRMPGMSGPELQRVLAERRTPVPIVFISSHGLEPARPRAADTTVACLLKPFSEAQLLQALSTALGRS